MKKLVDWKLVRTIALGGALAATVVIPVAAWAVSKARGVAKV